MKMPRIMTKVLPEYTRLPNGWLLIERKEDGARYKHCDGLQVIASVAQESDGKAWLHVSLSRRNRLPNYGDLCAVKREFIGPDKLALQLFVPEAEHVNLHPNCLHLWHCVDGDPVPKFAKQVKGLGLSI